MTFTVCMYNNTVKFAKFEKTEWSVKQNSSILVGVLCNVMGKCFYIKVDTIT